jgi:crotonobetainyl-CoA:carnitine CoA-transferase CaiB-like acyl-CoA transferase
VAVGEEQADRGEAGGPLAGVLVADFSRILAGPYATMLLADLGAEVVKVEGPNGDDTRSWMPPVREGTSTYYLGINRGKRSMVLDLRDDADAEVGRELARRADVLIENFKPGGLTKYGLDFDSVLATNPGIVYSSISGFGTGAGRNVPGYDLMVQAISGLMSLTGDPDGPPYRAGISVFDVMAGNHAVIGILAALRHRDATGQGQHVEVNLLSSALTGLVNHSSAYVAGGEVPYRMGNAHPSVFPYEPLPTADNDLIITAANDGQFRKLCEVLGVPELADDPRFAAPAGRAAGPQGGGRVVRAARRRGRAERADQHHRRRLRDGRAVRAGPGRGGRGGGPRDPDDAAPDPAVRHARELPAAAARAGRARRGAAPVVGRGRAVTGARATRQAPAPAHPALGVRT